MSFGWMQLVKRIIRFLEMLFPLILNTLQTNIECHLLFLFVLITISLYYLDVHCLRMRLC